MRRRRLLAVLREFPGTPMNGIYPLLGSFPYHSHTIPINSLGAPGISLDVSDKIIVEMTPVNVKHPDFLGGKKSMSSCWYL